MNDSINESSIERKKERKKERTVKRMNECVNVPLKEKKIKHLK